MHDCLKIDDLVICTDVSSSIGELPFDEVKVSYEITGYYLARVVLMEMLASGGIPIAYTLGNCTAGGFDSIHKGIKSLLRELDYDLPSISSSESNFEVKQSAISLSLIGKRKERERNNGNIVLALAGVPLVGDEVVNNQFSIRAFKDLLSEKSVQYVLPVGSTGIKAEVLKGFLIELEDNDLVDIYKSAGPSTCAIVAYDSADFEIAIKHNLRKL